MFDDSKKILEVVTMFTRLLVVCFFWLAGLLLPAAASGPVPVLDESRVWAVSLLDQTFVGAVPVVSLESHRSNAPPRYDVASGDCSGPTKPALQGPAPKVHAGKQGKHQPGHNNFQQGKSELTGDPNTLGRQAGTGQQVGNKQVGTAGSKERVDFGETIGNHVDPATGASNATSKGIIHYAKDGIHIVPAKP
jgi:hypothetical protein